MTEEQKHFMRTTLADFIRREGGNQFAMDHWRTQFAGRCSLYFDGVKHELGGCGTIACIGGSAEMLLGVSADSSPDVVCDLLGLNANQGVGLFYGWNTSAFFTEECKSHRWPGEFQRRYAEADTPAAKAEVAAELLALVADTDGECLRFGWKRKAAAVAEPEPEPELELELVP